VFALLDHLSKWVREVRQDILRKKSNARRSRVAQRNSPEEQLYLVDSVLSTIDKDLLAKAALQCKAYALSLMNFEQQIVALREREPTASITNHQMQQYYEHLHEIYSHLDEPDGMEGVSTLIISPSLEHQIRQHESTGKWTSAQSCWEVRLQQSPDQLDYHIGLLRCLGNLGHYGEDRAEMWAYSQLLIVA
jgi:serine/threonine-protein kinase ATR